MARTTDELVGAVIDVDSSITLTPFIDAANLIVNQCCLDYDTAYTDDHLTQIETWLAAHFYAIRDPRTTREKAGSVSETFQSKVDLGFDVTHYGQMAMRLDNQGGLGGLNNRIKKGSGIIPSGTFLGTDNSIDVSTY